MAAYDEAPAPTTAYEMPASDDQLDHLLKAFAKFLAAGFPVSAAKLGVLARWLGPSQLPAKADIADSQLDRALTASEAWAIHHSGFENPYIDLIEFLEGGGEVGRWENHILDVYLPSGDRCGVPLSTFEAAARGAVPRNS